MTSEVPLVATEPVARTARYLAIGTWLMVPVGPMAALLIGGSFVALLIVGFAFATLGTLGLRVGGRSGRIALSLGLVGQAIVFTAAFAGHPWQLDSHMIFFAFLATLMVLADPIVIVIAAGAIAVHHLSLSILLPQMIYPSSGLAENLQRTIMHGAIVAVEAAVLFWAISSRNRMDAENRASQADAKIAQRNAEAAKGEAEQAQKAAEAALADAREAQVAADEARRHAEAETERAREADARARTQEEQDRLERDAAQREQDHVVQHLREALAALASGRLTHSVDAVFPPEYEDLRRDYNQSLASLNEALGKVQSTAVTIGHETSGIAVAADTLARRSETQAASLAELSATADSMVRQTAEDASEASKTADQTRLRADESATLVAEAIEMMKRIETSSAEIQSIITVIDEIAFQTNLLALNAGVEAARAGDAGRGFAVVASEVRSLAQRSSEAAKEIRGLIEASSRQVSEGVDVVNGTGAALSDVSSAVVEMTDKIGSIAQIAREQAEGLGEINSALSNLDGVNQNNSASLEETNAASQTLKARTDDLARALDAFDVAGSGRSDTERDRIDAASNRAA